jgi:hypothetical protein
MGRSQVSTVPPVRVQRNTGLRIPKRKANAILRALANGRSIRSICKEYKTNHHAVAALKLNRAEDYERVRSELRDEWRALAAIGTSELIARVGLMNTITLSAAAGIATDKAALLADVSEQVTPPTPQPATEAWDAYVGTLRSTP